MSNVKINEIVGGDFFGETSYYTAAADPGGNHIPETYIHNSTGETVRISDSYVNKYFKSGDQYQKTKEVTLEDKKDDAKTPGIRTIFENIGQQPFTVMFHAKSKETKTALKKRRLEQAEEAANAIEKAKNNKKSMYKAAMEQIEKIQDNPVVFEPRERILKGYKLSWKSRDGKYDVYDIEAKGNRLVNINTIQWIVVDGILYYTTDAKKKLKEKGII